MSQQMDRRITVVKTLTPDKLTNSTRHLPRNRKRLWSERTRHSRSPLYSLTSTYRFKLTKMRAVLSDAKMRKAMARLRTSVRRRSSLCALLSSLIITRFAQLRDSTMCYSSSCLIRLSLSGSISLITICKISIKSSWISLTLRLCTFMATTSRTLRRQENCRTYPNFKHLTSMATSLSRSRVTACGSWEWCMRSTRPSRSLTMCWSHARSSTRSSYGTRDFSKAKNKSSADSSPRISSLFHRRRRKRQRLVLVSLADTDDDPTALSVLYIFKLLI